MSGLWWGLAFCLATAAGASAQVSVTTSRMVTVQDQDDGLYMSGAVADSAVQYSYPNGSYASYQAIENYQVSADVTPGEITFANASTSQGFGASTSTSTTVAVTYTNSGNARINNVTLDSTILPGGFGLYTDSPKSNPTLSGISIGDVNQTPGSSYATFDNVEAYGAAGPGGSVGYAGFTFQIFNNNALIENFSANVALYLTQNGAGQTVSSVVLTGAPRLNGFALVTPVGSDQAVGYQWGATDVAASLGALAVGQSSTLKYVTTVTTSSYIQNDTDCGAENLCAQLLTYSGFGDPLHTAKGTGTDPYFPTFELTVPTFDQTTGVIGGLGIEAVTPSLPLTGVTSATFAPIPNAILDPVPEPETWALMLAGFGVVGAMLRRRQYGAFTRLDVDDRIRCRHLWR